MILVLVLGSEDEPDEDTDIEDLSGADTEVCVSSDSDNTIVADDDIEPCFRLTRQNALSHSEWKSFMDNQH